MSTGEDAGFWAKVLRAAGRGQSYAGFSPAAVRALLAQIEGSFLHEPYQFSDGNELAGAPAILAGKPKTPYDVLYKQLFVAELNDASGRGLVANPDLQDALLAWGESLLVQNQPASASARSITATSATSSSLGDAANVFLLINNSRGGGDIPD